MLRVLYFLGLIFIPAIFGWWVFIPIVLIFVYLNKFPFEIIFAGIILDSIYYYGDGILAQNRMLIFSALVLLAVWFLDKKIHWAKII